MKCHLAPLLALAAGFLPIVTSQCPSGSIVEIGTQTPKLDIVGTPKIEFRGVEYIGLCFTQLGLAEPWSTVKIELDTRGDFDARREYVDVYNSLAPPRFIGEAQGRDRNNNKQCGRDFTDVFEVTAEEYNTWVWRGVVFFGLDISTAVNGAQCNQNWVRLRVNIMQPYVPTMACPSGALPTVSVPGMTSEFESLENRGDTITFCFTELPMATPMTSVDIQVRGKGNFKSSAERVRLGSGIAGPFDIGTYEGDRRNCMQTPWETFTVSAETYNSWIMDGVVVIQAISTKEVGAKCDENLIQLKVTVNEPKCGSCVGDPHFQTWGEQWYDFHGICDLNMLKNDKFAEGKGMDIHVRTKARYQYSYIEAASIRIGEDILQVGSWGQYWLNGVEGAELPAIMGEKYAVTHHSEHKRRHDFKISLTEAVQEAIVIRTVKDIVSVTVENGTYTHFGASEGLMGNYMTGAKLARDGTPMDDDNRFGQEWQVLPTEDKLFQSPSVYEFGNCKPPAFEVTAEGRRLGESRIATEAAEKACADVDADKKDMCIFDVKAMDDVEIADIHVSV